MTPQAIYYHRKKAGLTGTRQNPDRHWRKEKPEEKPARTPANVWDWNTGAPSIFRREDVYRPTGRA